jgi:tRNA (cmo5U34)-methyltransferase
MSTTSDPRGIHDWHSASYVDNWIASDATNDAARLPWLTRLVGFLPFDQDRAIRVLDIGAGYGLLTRKVIDRYPLAEVVLVDFSEPMFDHAQRRLADVAGQLTFVVADLRNLEWTASIPGNFDAVVSSIAIHNLRDPDVIRRVFEQIRPLIRPGGCFYDIDLVPPAGPLTAQAIGLRRLSNTRPGYFVGLEMQLRWLREAGFDEVDCLLRIDGQTLMAGFVS